MKRVEDIVACVVDYGTFISLADKLSESCRKVYYYSPIEDEFRNVMDCVIGDGLARPGHRIERVDEFMSPEVIAETDLFVFPDIGWGGTQRYLRGLGKAVWGSMGADELELYRTRFLAVLKEIGLPVIPSVTCVGLAALAAHLKTVKDKWVKINVYRENMETWHHFDWEHSQRMLEYLAVEFGGVKEYVVFVVQDHLETDVEIGYDGWTVNGQFPAESFQGYELKNELYLGSLLTYKALPEQVRRINEALAPVLARYEYRNFVATEIRVKGSQAYFIDPTMRMPGQTGEQLLETCSNLPDVIWQGANGVLIKPKFNCKFAVEATLHYTENADIWKTIRVPTDVERWTKLYHYCIVDGVYQFPARKTDELGVLLGVGNTIETALAHLKGNLAKFTNEPVYAKVEKFAELLAKVRTAEKQGVEFTNQPVPKPSIALAMGK